MACAESPTSAVRPRWYEGSGSSRWYTSWRSTWSGPTEAMIPGTGSCQAPYLRSSSAFSSSAARAPAGTAAAA